MPRKEIQEHFFFGCPCVKGNNWFSYITPGKTYCQSSRKLSVSETSLACGLVVHINLVIACFVQASDDRLLTMGIDHHNQRLLRLINRLFPIIGTPLLPTPNFFGNLALIYPDMSKIIWNFMLLYLMLASCNLIGQLNGRHVWLLYLMLVSCNLIGQLKGWHFWMSHGFNKGYRREGDIKKNVTCANICAYGSNRETNGGRRGILSNVIAIGDIKLKCHPVRKVIW